MRRSCSATLLCAAACFSDAPPADPGGSSTSSASSTSDSDGPLEGTTSTASAATSVDTTGGGLATSDGSETTGTTGLPGSCDNGLTEIGELCLDVEAAYTRDMDGSIHAIAIAAFDDTVGDGGALGVTPTGDPYVRWWFWDGGAAGPLVGALAPAGTSDPLAIVSGDHDGAPGDELLYATQSQFMRLRALGKPLQDGPCTAGDQLLGFTLAQLDQDEPLEALGITTGAANRLVAWTDETNLCTSESQDFTDKLNHVEALATNDGASQILLQITATALEIGDISADPFAYMMVETYAHRDGIKDMRVGDLDGNGLRDDLVVLADGGFSVLLRASEGAFVAGSEVVAGGSVRDFAVVDLDGDGDGDVVVVDETSTEIGLLLGDGAGTLVYASGPESPTPSVAVAAGDVNGDSAVDIVVGDADGIVRWFLANP